MADMADASAERVLPLQGIGVLVTREVKQAVELSAALKELGAVVTELPVLEFRAPVDTTAIDQAINTIHKYDWILFASTNAIDFFAQRLVAHGKSMDSLKNAVTSCRLAAIGAKTAEHLRASFGLETDFIPDNYIAESFVEEFAAGRKLHGLSLLWPRSSKGRVYIKEELEKAGAIVDMVVAYETCRPAVSAGVIKVRSMLAAREIQYIVITSSEAARNFVEFMKEGEGNLDLQELSASVTLCSIGDQTSATLRSLLSNRLIQPEQFTQPALVECIVQDVQTGR